MKSQQNLVNQYKIDLDEGLDQHDKKAFLKCCEILAFLVRDAAHITPDNFESCIHCLRTFVEACVSSCDRENKKKQMESQKQQQKNHGNKNVKSSPRSNINSTNNNSSVQKANRQSKQLSNNDLSGTGQNSLKHSITYHGQVLSNEFNHEDEDEDSLTGSYETMSLRLLDLLDTLHNKAASIFTSWSEEKLRSPTQIVTVIDINTSVLWIKCWCPILQGIARLSCDVNGEIRMQALQYLQRALLVHDLQTLSAVEWEACFNKVKLQMRKKL